MVGSVGEDFVTVDGKDVTVVSVVLVTVTGGLVDNGVVFCAILGGVEDCVSVEATCW